MIGDEVWSMQVGEISDPIRIHDDHYEVIQVTAERPVDFESWRPKLYPQLFKQKFAEQKEVLIERLTDELHVSLNAEALQILLRRLAVHGPTLTLPPTEENMMLYRFDGGGVTLGEYLRRSRSDRPRPTVPLDSTQVISFVRRAMLPEKILTEGARRAGIEHDREVSAWLKRKWEELLIRTLRQEEVVERMGITDEDIREEYKAHPERYMLPPEIRVQEILLETEEEAQRVLQELRNGADMEELAAQRTTRSGMRKHKGNFHMHPLEKPLYGPLYEEAERAELNTTLGPLKVKEGYSVFRVLERLPERLESFESAKRRARAFLRIERRENLFRELVANLRIKYASKVKIFEEALQAAVNPAI
jgi:parvulin-like peptidyl-prolyl isomerase